MMTFRATLIWFVGTVAVFGACCLIMARSGHDMNAPVVVYPFMAVWGFSALAWPLFAVLAWRARNDR